MIVAWIVITLMIGAIVVGPIAAVTAGRAVDSPAFGYVWGVWLTICLSSLIAVVYVAAHFIGKYW